MCTGIAHTGLAFKSIYIRVCPESSEVFPGLSCHLPACQQLMLCCCTPAGLQAIKAFKREDFVGVCGFSSLDWVTSDFTDCYSGVLSLCDDC